MKTIIFLIIFTASFALGQEWLMISDFDKYEINTYDVTDEIQEQSTLRYQKNEFIRCYHEFNPQKDITVYELAIIFKYKDDTWGTPKGILNKHFKEICY